MVEQRIYETTEFLEICDEKIRSIYDYWDDKRDQRRMPSRADIDPLDIPRLLANLSLIDVSHEPMEFTYRLVGTSTVRKRGFDPTGKNVSEAFSGPNLKYVLSNFRWTAEHGLPQFSNKLFSDPRGWAVNLERLYLPVQGTRVCKMAIS